MSKESVAVFCTKRKDCVNFTITSTQTSNVLSNINITNVMLEDIKEWCSGKKMESWKLTRLDRKFCSQGILLPDLDRELKNKAFSLDQFARHAFANRYSVASVVS